MERTPIIVLPPRIAVLRDSSETYLKINIQEFNLYFKNMILPYREEYDVQIRCDYGRNFGTFWRLSEFPHDIDSFDLEVVIYNEYGEQIASKKTLIELCDRKESDPNYHLLCIGDSMTYSNVYLEHVASNIHNIVFKGIRNNFGHIAHEGRGGWSYRNFFQNYENNFGVSPFLFPKGVDGYMGNIDFIRELNDEAACQYNFTGYKKYTFEEGAVYGDGGKLYRYVNGDFQLYCDKPQWEADFGKYVERYQVGQIDCVSLLMGANDLQYTTYENSDEEIAQYIANTRKMIDLIHRYDQNIAIIVNLPVSGAEAYAWGTQLGCKSSSKMYRYNIMRASEALISHFGDSEDENIYICPMLLCIDPENGFPHEYYRVNRYSEMQKKHQSNWVHPNRAGYFQMADALCGTLQKIRHK